MIYFTKYRLYISVKKLIFNQKIDFILLQYYQIFVILIIRIFKLLLSLISLKLIKISKNNIKNQKIDIIFIS